MLKAIVKKIRKRDGRVAPFDRSKISNAIFKAAKFIQGKDRKEAELVTDKVILYINQKFKPPKIPSVEEVQDLVIRTLLETGHEKTAKAYMLYRHKRTVEREAKKEIGIPDDLKMPLNSLQVLQRRYLIRDKNGRIVETPREMFKRVSKHIVSAERRWNKNQKAIFQYEKAFFEMMANSEFLPNSPCLMNSGTELGQLAACFILPVEDDIGGIFDTVKYAAMIHKTAGGTGFCFSYLRPKGDIVKTTAGVASGPISFMTIIDRVTDVIKQGGRRRGANMAVLHVWHPDIEEFVCAKEKPGFLENFNVSVAVDDKFMHAVQMSHSYDLINPRTGKRVKTINARKLFQLICKSAWKAAEPGMLFMNEINRTNPTPKYKINATNPCAEVPMPDFESCNLGSINVAKFAEFDWTKKNWKKKLDWKRLRKTIRLAVRFLDNIIDLNNYPIPLIREMSLKHRRIGLGVMGFARMLANMGERYDSPEALKIAEKLMNFIHKEARKMSQELGVIRGSFPEFKNSALKHKYSAMRNATVTSIAPTGTISMIANTSSGIEPLFALSYVKTVRAGSFYYSDESFDKILKMRGLYSEKLMQKLAKEGTATKIKEIPRNIRNVFRVAYDISPEYHIKMQAAFQKNTDLAVSKTINLPANARVSDVEQAYMLAWKLKCKGITIYRDKSRREQVLHIGKKPKTKGVKEEH